jgi:DNA-binding beta-propeller fold protein YncE
MQNHFRNQAVDNSQTGGTTKRTIIFLAAFLLLATTAALTIRWVIKNRRPPTQREAAGKVMTLAGAGYPGVADGAALQTTFSDPFGVAVDSKGNLVIADGGAGNRLRRITPQGNVETLAGSDEGFADGNALEAKFNTPSGIAIDRYDNIYIADTSNHRIRKLDNKGRVTTIAGSGIAGYQDGVAAYAMFDGPIGVAVDEQGTLYVADTYNDRIRKITTEGLVTTVAGAGVAGYRDGGNTDAWFDTPCGIAVDGQGTLFIADTGNNAIRKVSAAGEVSTLAGNGGGDSDWDSRLSEPAGLVLTHDGFLFVSNQSHGRIQLITPEGEIKDFAGGNSGFADGLGREARFNGASGIAVDKQGNLYVTDSHNYLVRKIVPVIQTPFAGFKADEILIQPFEADAASLNVAGGAPQARPLIPDLSQETLGLRSPFPWPLNPQNQWHEVAGVVGEVRGWFNGEARHHLHSGLDIVGKMGEPVLSVIDEKVSAPLSTWGFNDSGEGIQIGLMSYIHIRVGRDLKDQIRVGEKFKPRFDGTGAMSGVRVRRGTRFKVGDFIGTLNRLYHVHMNLGPRGAEANALQFPFVNFKDTVAPVIEANGIEVMSAGGSTPFKEKADGRLLVGGDVAIVVTAYDQVDGNNKSRKLGLYRLGYQLLNADGTPVKGFEQPLINIEFNRLPADDQAVLKAFAEGSGVSAYGTPTKFKYVVTNHIRDGESRQGLLRTSQFSPGNYLLKVVAEDYAGNRATGKMAELAITLR